MSSDQPILQLPASTTGQGEPTTTTRAAREPVSAADFANEYHSRKSEEEGKEAAVGYSRRYDQVDRWLESHYVWRLFKTERENYGGPWADPGFEYMRDPDQLFSALVVFVRNLGYKITASEYTRIQAMSTSSLRAAGVDLIALLRMLLGDRRAADPTPARTAVRSSLSTPTTSQPQLRSFGGASRKNLSIRRGEPQVREKAKQALFQSTHARGEDQRSMREELDDDDFFPEEEDHDYMRSRDPQLRAEDDYPDDLSDIFDGYDQDHDSGGRPGVSATTTRIRMSATQELKEYDGRSFDEEKARSWFSKIRAALESDQYTDLEKCRKFPTLLKGPAKNWYTELPRHDRIQWKTLAEKFQVQYCGKGTSKLKQYNDMRRRDTEDPLDYLFRLNTAAIRARIRLHNGSPEEKKEHVEHFIETLQDEDLADDLTKLCLRDEDGLQTVLQEMRKRVVRRGGQGKKTAAQKERVGRSANRKIHALARAVIQSDSERSESEPDSEEDQTSDDEITMMAKIFAAMKAKAPTDRSEENGEKCSHCGSTRHSDLKCWKRLTCQHCQKQGHPTDRCFLLCKGCGQVHDRGECALEEAMTKLKMWYNPTQHAGILPKSVEDQLN